MARKPEPMTFSGALEVQAQKPLDARTRVELKTDLTDAASFPYAYEGMTVYVVEEQKEYMLVGADTTVLANWREKGSGSGGTTDWSDITNKPTDLVQDASYVHTDNNFTNDDKYNVALALNDSAAAVETAESANNLAYSAQGVADQTYDILTSQVQPMVAEHETAIEDRYTKAEADALLADKADKATTYTKAETDAALANKQDTLESGVSIKTVNGNSLLGSGNIDIGGGGGNANFDISTVPLGGAGVYEVNAFLNNNDSERVRAIYSRGVNGELPDWFSMSVTSGLGTDDFHVATKEYADKEVAKKGNAKITFDNEYQYLQIRDDNGTDIGFSQETANTVRVQEYAKDSRGQVQPIFDETLTSKAYVDGALANKQDTLVSGTNIKTVNGNDITGAGNVQIRSGVGDEYDINNMPSYNEIAADIANHQLRYIEGNWQVRGIGWSDESNVVSLWAAYDRQIKTYDFEPTGKDDPLPEPYSITYGYTNATFMGVISSPYRGVSFNYNNDGFARYELNDDSIKFLQREPNKQTIFEKTYTIGTHIAVNEEKWCGTYKDDSGTTYQVYSKMIFIPALPAAAGVEGYPHGITGIKQILQVYGFTTDGFVLNAPRQNIQDNIGIYQVQKAGNIQIEVGKDRSSKAAYVCLVYAKNN